MNSGGPDSVSCAITGVRVADMELAAEGERLRDLVAAWEAEQAHRRAVDPEGLAAEERDLTGVHGGDGSESFIAHVIVPDQAAIKQAVLARRKEELLAKLAGSGEAEEQTARFEHLDAIRRLPPRDLQSRMGRFGLRLDLRLVLQFAI